MFLIIIDIYYIYMLFFIQGLLVVLLGTIAYLSYDRYNHCTEEGALEYGWLELNQTHVEGKGAKQEDWLEFELEGETLIIHGREEVRVQVRKFGLQEEDARTIRQILRISDFNSQEVYQISSPYFLLVYSVPHQHVCYENYQPQSHLPNFHIYNGLLWIFIRPSPSVILLQVNDCSNGGLVHSQKHLLPAKVQKIIDISEQASQVDVSLLTHGRDPLQMSFHLDTYQLLNEKVMSSHQFLYLEKNLTSFSVKLQQKHWEIQASQLSDYILHWLSLGYLMDIPLPPKAMPEIESQFGFQVVDQAKAQILSIDRTAKQFSVESLGDNLFPFRTPIFTDDFSQLPVDMELKQSKTTPKTKTYQAYSNTGIMEENKLGIYRCHPDANVHHISFDKDFIHFYPVQNFKPEDYYFIRIKKGALVLKGAKIEGAYDNLPIHDQNDLNIHMGFASDQVYQELTTSGIEVMPSVFEAHVGYRHFFTYKKSNRLELIHGLNGNSVLSHYFTSSAYQYSTSFIENNEFWVFEHHKAYQQPPIITKYELFVNSSSPKTVLYIKRNYHLDVEGKILGVQRCVDSFYYFEYIGHSGLYGIARIHQRKLSNRQALPHENYSGAFQAAMVLKNIGKDPKRGVSDLEEGWVILEMSNQPNERAQKLKHIHQFSILPYRVYSLQQHYFIYNLRKLMISAYSIQKIRLEKQLSQMAYVYALGIMLAVLFVKPLLSIISRATKKKEIINIENKETENSKEDKKKKKKQ